MLINESEKLEVLQNELLEKENIKIDILNEKLKNRRNIEQKKFEQIEYGYPIIRENYSSNKQFYMED